MQANYIIGQTRSGKDIAILHPVTIIESRGERTLIRWSAEEFTSPNEIAEVWTSRLRAI